MFESRSAMRGPVASLLVPLCALACMSAAICAQVGEAGGGDVSRTIESEPLDARAELPQDSPSSSTYSFRERNEQIVRLAFPGLAYCPGAWLWVLDESIEGVPLEGRSLEGRAYFPDAGRGTELIEGVLTYIDDHSRVHSEWFELTITEAVAVGPSDLEEAIADLQMLRDEPAFERVIRMLDEGAPSDPWWPVAPGTEGTVADAIELLHRPTTATVSGAIVTNLNPSPVPVGGQITTGTSDAGITTTTFVAMTDTYVPIQKSNEQLMEELSTGWAWLDQIAQDPESADIEAIAATLTRKAERGFEAWDRRFDEAIDELLRKFPDMPDPRDEEWQIPISAADEAALEALLEEAAERGWDLDPLPFVESGILRLIPRAQPINEPMEIPPVPEAPPPEWEIEPIELPCVWDDDCQRCVDTYVERRAFYEDLANLLLEAAVSDYVAKIQQAATARAAAIQQARESQMLKLRALQAAAVLLMVRLRLYPEPNCASGVLRHGVRRLWDRRLPSSSRGHTKDRRCRVGLQISLGTRVGEVHERLGVHHRVVATPTPGGIRREGEVP